MKGRLRRRWGRSRTTRWRCFPSTRRSLISEENAAAFFAGLARALSRGAKILLLLLPAVLLVHLLIRNAYQTPNNDYAADTKPLRLYKKIEGATWGRCKAFCKSYAAFLGARRGYLWAAALIWAYNLNAVTIFVEFLAWVFYFAISLDVLHIYTQIAKLAMDLTVAVGFLARASARGGCAGTKRGTGHFWTSIRARCSSWANSGRKRRR